MQPENSKETHLSVEESQTSISSWWRRCGGGVAGGAGETSSLAAAARETAIISLSRESGVTGTGGTPWSTDSVKLSLNQVIV